ncbi:hypothetical protein BTVI_54341 [Pitangus sulphuratus]|nr:hypothetical protein BTVI_54341 [Pitangus sulphuratus]
MDSGIECTLSKFDDDTKLCGGNPKHRQAGQRMESSPEEKDLRVVVDDKCNMTSQCAFAAQKVKRILDCVKRSMASRLMEVILPSTPLL